MNQPAITAYTHTSTTLDGDVVIDPTRVFYVTVRNDSRHGWLAGPFETHQEALDTVPAAKVLAMKADPMAHFYGFGSASLPRELEKLPKGVFNEKLQNAD